MTASAILSRLRSLRNPQDAAHLQRFFKTGPGEYGEGDVFLGLRVPTLRALLREYRGKVGWSELDRLLRSEFHEARLLALLLVVQRFRDGDKHEQRRAYAFYLARTRWINNWDLVDLSAEHVVGGWLFARSRRPLYRWARSRSLWERRIAVLATFHFIRRGDFGETLRLAERLLDDRHDLMHKAVGWMLREVGKRDPDALIRFLDRHAARMPRTMLRYAIERFPAAKRRAFMKRPALG